MNFTNIKGTLLRVQYHHWVLYNQFRRMKLKLFGKTISIHHRLSSDLHAVKEVEDHLQERTEDNADCTGHEEGDDSLVGIVLLNSSSDGLYQKLVSFDNVET